ncbi:hypothetical protein ABNF65_20640 [Paenibacillus larvae]
MLNLAEINNPLHSSIKKNYVEQPEQIQLELSFPGEIKAVLEGKQLEVKRNYSRFYIVTYEINEETKFIDSIKLTMPNSQNMTLELINDLSYLIQTSDFDITFEDTEPIQTEKTSDYAIYSEEKGSFGYSIPAKQEEKEAN